MAAAYDVMAKNMKTQYAAQQPETMYCARKATGVCTAARVEEGGWEVGQEAGRPPHLLEPVGESHLLGLGELVAYHLDLLGGVEEGHRRRDDTRDEPQPTTSSEPRVSPRATTHLWP